MKSLAHRLKQVILDTAEQIREAQLLLVASSLAYTTILSIIPVLAVSFAVFKAFGGLEKLYDTIEPIILSNLAEGTSDEVIERVRTFIQNIHGGTVGIGGFIGLIFTSMSMLSSIESALNRIWRVKNTRSWFQRFSTYWLFITLGPLALSIAIGMATSADLPLRNLLPSGSGGFTIAVAVFFFVFKFVPNCVVKWRYALIAATVTAILWNLTRIGYNLYIDRFAAYNKIYGSLGAIPILLLWIYIVWIIVLSGAALSAALQKRIPELDPSRRPGHTTS